MSETDLPIRPEDYDPSLQTKKNLVYFEANTMRELYEDMDKWQNSWNKRFISLSIQRDMPVGSLKLLKGGFGKFGCIALTEGQAPPQPKSLLSSLYKGT